MDLENNYVVPTILSGNSIFKPTSRIVLTGIFNLMISNKSPNLLASDVDIGEFAEVSSRSVSRSIKLLEQHGMLSRTYSSNRRTIHLGHVFKEWLIEANKVSEVKFEYLL